LNDSKLCVIDLKDLILFEMTMTKIKPQKSIPIYLLTQNCFGGWLKKQTNFIKNWISSTKYEALNGTMRVIPNQSGQLESIIFSLIDEKDFWSVGQLSLLLPENQSYHFVFDELTIQPDKQMITKFDMAWQLGAYQFNRYKKPLRSPAKLISTNQLANDLVSAIYLIRDLTNTPADDLGPTELTEVVTKLAKKFKANFKQIIGDQLLAKKFNAIYTVGRASDDAPRLLDLSWGNKKHPKVTLVGKGVCFDTGGLDLKNSAGMLLMKKDMSGAAHVLGLAQLIMQNKLPIRLRVLIPAVENSVSGNAYRPGDVITMLGGKTVEIGNTDAEGRLILADALTEAVSESPSLLIDMATLTGAARVAVGTELAAFFTNQQTLANELIQHGEIEKDYVWQLPLFAAYREGLNSTIADINNVGSDSYAGAISAALFLKEFIPDNIPWLHFDIMAWNLRNRPGRPQGGEAMGIRALFAYLADRFK